jgi:hypothetical protein
MYNLSTTPPNYMAKIRSLAGGETTKIIAITASAFSEQR